jgi:hypothetical protein
MLLGFSLGNYLLLVDYTGRLFREGKTVISAELTGILNRLGTTAESSQARLEKLKSGRLLGRFFAASRERLREAATRPRVHHLANLVRCSAREREWIPPPVLGSTSWHVNQSESGNTKQCRAIQRLSASFSS